MKWIAFFSKTGSELSELTTRLGRWPDKLITNRKSLDGCHQDILDAYQYFPEKFIFISNNPTEVEYTNAINSIWAEKLFITLHGYMRILPEKICKTYDIYNGHPGLITKYPELKGKNPQLNAWTKFLKTSGCVIHKVTPEVDGGEVIAEVEVSIEGLSLDNVIKKLHCNSIDLWESFLKDRLMVKEPEIKNGKLANALDKLKNKALEAETAVSYCELHYPETIKELRRLQEEEFILFCKKQFDYGPGNISVGQNTASAEGKRLSLYSIIFRCNDKVQRLLNLMVKNNATAQNEPAMDAFSDLSLYGKIAKIVDKGVWGK